MTDESSEQPVVRDRRRIDPDTGEGTAWSSGHEGDSPASTPGDDTPMAEDVPQTSEDVPQTSEGKSGDRVAELEQELAERTSDLQRLQAEYLNYKRRVDRDRAAAREGATADVLARLLPVLDDIDRADEHGELEGGFKAVADSFHRTLHGLGLERFGEVGEPFDPRVHEALMHQHSDDVDGPVCSAILQPGYRIGERIVRPARVAVAEPEFPAAVTDEAAATDDAALPGPADPTAPENAEPRQPDEGESASGGAGGEAPPDQEAAAPPDQQSAAPPDQQS